MPRSFHGPLYGIHSVASIPDYRYTALFCYSTASISYDVKIAKFMLLEEVQKFIDDFYSILTIKLDERTKEVQKFYEKECEKHGKKD